MFKRAANTLLIILSVTGLLKAEEKPVYIFAHGLGSTKEQINLFADCILGPSFSCTFNDAKEEGSYHAAEVNLGQQEDIDVLHALYKEVREKYPQNPIVLMGLSRGAAVCLNYVAIHKPQGLVGLVLESPYDTFENLVEHIMKRFNVSFLPLKYGIAAATYHFKKVDPVGVFPARIIDQIPSDLPIIFVHAKNDNVVPIKSSRNLFWSLITKNSKDIYLYEIPESNHGKLMLGDYAHHYKAFVHAWYKKYNMPYNQEFACQGQELLRKAQLPSLDSFYPDQYDTTRFGHESFLLLSYCIAMAAFFPYFLKILKRP